MIISIDAKKFVNLNEDNFSKFFAKSKITKMSENENIHRCQKIRQFNRGQFFSIFSKH